ncbi:dapper homolog 3 isoform X2 [Rhinatrema bivittatum]|uniref:dapper homolog 3 isoform X2 n=1 Tax=Rhinatrema bivittatum TaxID=194408 RepID=UPI001129BC51|nr:dapper homolog 3 isoform X2 [Rhinatrema bivittatum]
MVMMTRDARTERMWELVQRVEDLRLDAENSCGEVVETDSWPSSGFCESASPVLPSESPASVFGECFSSFPSVAGSYSRIGHTEARIHFANERPKSAGDLGHGEKDGSGGTARIMVPRSFSAPYSSSQDYTSDAAPHYQARGAREPFYPSPLHAVTLQNLLACSSPLRGAGYKDASFAAYPEGGVAAATEDMDAYGACPSDFQFFPGPSHCRRVENYMLALIHRRGQPTRSSKPPRTSLNPEPGRGLARQNSQCKRPLELRGPLCERKYPSQGERGDTPSPGAYENSGGVAGRIWASWDAGADAVSATKSPVTSQASEVFSPPHLSLKKPPKLQASAAHLRAASMDHYPPSASCPLPDGRGFDSPLNETNSSLPQPFSRHGAGAPNLHSPANEGRPGYEPCEKRPPLMAMEEEEGGAQMVSAQYIPAQVAPRLQAAHRNARRKPPPLCKGRSVELSPEHCPANARERQRAGAVAAAPRKCHFTEEEGDGGKRGGRKGSPRGKKTIRSQSENSLLNKHAAPDRTATKYHTVDREEVAQSKPAQQRRQNAAAYRKWRSTAEICRDEASPSDPYRAPKRSKKLAKGLAPGSVSPGPRNLLYGYTESDSEFSADCGAGRQAPPVCEPEDEVRGFAAPCYGESGSSLSEAESPAFSSCSSDTDESGGLVWPQQLSPQVVSSTGPGNSGGQPKVFVKIKASHALKKKIMRFRTGSLKVMTTV